MQNTFTTTEAAEYLGMSKANVKYHVYSSGRLKGELVKTKLVGSGSYLTFSRAELDRFKANPPKPGGPKKLTADQVREIRRLWETGERSQMSLGREFSTSHDNVSRIVNRKVWKNI